ncbi:pyridoxamine 5-phosphate oxidase [Arthrobacter sp. ERGS1:01]|uniref:DUF1697 domain-containing protein n=1 Tax=Arthrobacter sp. ERGS1:01 TaxID=1704044 RepID=UPI0006B482EF|nr:DUF1697 domain-containing protein [Arthrobacter sp. ERGS1:01]ALE06478.1 pyridoxamine 5-phosphate oxidase [Arthrobacter sp. ERGS1:01]
MTNFGVFLRGINVGGINIKMADLRTALTALPITGVKTLLASGNVVCSARTDGPAVKTLVENCLRENFGYDAWVVVLDQAQLAAIIEACPYPADNKEQHSYLTLSSDPAILDELEQLGRELPDTVLARLSPESLAWLAPAGGTLDSPFSKLSAKVKYKSTTTTRNLRTMLKVRDALGS